MKNSITTYILTAEILEYLTIRCRVIDTAASQLTKTAITVTVIFIVALGYDCWYYILGYSGVTEYKLNTPIQTIGKKPFKYGSKDILSRK